MKTFEWAGPAGINTLIGEVEPGKVFAVPRDITAEQAKILEGEGQLREITKRPAPKQEVD